jgi:sodium/potassium-transporting ATPase subunit alpha
MGRKPRDPNKDRLVSTALLFYSYVTAGFVISSGCLLAYMFIFFSHDLILSDFHRPDLDAAGKNFFTLSTSESVYVERTDTTYTPDLQRKIVTEAVTAFYVTLTVAQFCHIWVCKTRITSLFVHGFSNTLTFYGVAVGLVLVLFFSYMPGVQNFVGSGNVSWMPWVVALGTGAVLWIYNEASKWLFRKCKPDNALVRLLSW